MTLILAINSFESNKTHNGWFFLPKRLRGKIGDCLFAIFILLYDFRYLFCHISLNYFCVCINLFLFYLAVGLIEKLQANRCDIGLSFDSTASLLFSFALCSDCFLTGLAELAFAGGIFAVGVF